MDCDLLIKGGRVIDPASGRDGYFDVAFRNGRVSAIAAEIPPHGARQVVDAVGAFVTPGLIDFHSHVYWGGTSLGVDADRVALRSGTTTFVDAGSAGAGNFLGFRKHVIERSNVRILAFLNISFAGIFGFSSSMMIGECEDIRLCDPREAVPCAKDNLDLIVGMKVRAGRIAGGASGIAPLDMALDAADALDLPLMTHLDYPPPATIDVMPRLRPGDILTHCYKSFPNAPIDRDGKVRDIIRAARERGVYFDIGHGMGSMDFGTARAMLADGFAPDIVSSDLHLFCVDGPAFDLLVCLSKLHALGMSLPDVIRSATQTPAEAIGRSDIGSLKEGIAGDAAVLRFAPGETTFVDSKGKTITGEGRLVSDGIVFGGAWRANDGPDAIPPIDRCHPHPPKFHADAVRHFFGADPA